MDMLEAQNDLVRDPLAWAADCRMQADFDIEPEAQAAFVQLAEEFAAASAEIEGLISTFEAVVRRRRTA